ncbi:MAG: type II toxin-antitoxin system VapC family toxin [Anaerolineaceae bacterium]|nr:type II toxin-antitoxin system VapC family toxin [Anaerolineaceae bacterium]
MNYLLDTHILLWALAGKNLSGKKLPDTVVNILYNPLNSIYYSSVNIFEIEIKRITNPQEKIPTGEDVIAFSRQAGYIMLPLSEEHALLMKTLQKDDTVRNHKDPYDWLLVSQAKYEGMKFITSDSKLKYYTEPCILSV